MGMTQGGSAGAFFGGVGFPEPLLHPSHGSLPSADITKHINFPRKGWKGKEKLGWHWCVEQEQLHGASSGLPGGSAGLRPPRSIPALPAAGRVRPQGLSSAKFLLFYPI